MGLLCNILDHKDEAINFWGDNAEYILNKCKRCGREEIFCFYEGKTFANDDVGKDILSKMMNDKVFSKACHIHYQFIRAEQDNVFNFKKQDEEYKKLKVKFNLPETFVPACPVELYKKGLWNNNNSYKSISKDSKPAKSKTKGEAGTSKVKGEIKKPKPVSKGKKTKYGNYKGKADVEGRETLEQLENLEKIYVEKEDYERAAEIHKKIKDFKSQNK